MFDYIRNIFHIIKCETEGRKMIEQFANYGFTIDKYSPDKYTVKELKEVVGKLPFNLWTEEHHKELNKRFNKRVQKFKRFCDQENIKLDIDKQKHPEKYKGIMQLIEYGYADDYFTGSQEPNARSITPNRYRSYKSLNKKDDEIDDDYKEWYYNMFDEYFNIKFPSL